jgi:hypothetical protein
MPVLPQACIERMLPDVRRRSLSVAGAFYQERDASYAIRLMTTATDADIRYSLRHVLSESGEVQMVVLEATFADPSLASRIETAMEGAHGMVVPTEVLAVARAG